MVRYDFGKKKKNPYALVVKNVDIVLEGVHLSVKIMTFLIVLCVLMSTRILLLGCVLF